MIETGDCGDKGRGVIARKRLVKGEIIERAPVIVIPRAQLEHLEKTVMSYHTYSWGANEEDGAIALGHGSLYNHAFQPNAEYIKVFAERIIAIIAIRDIEEGEEITVNYNDSPEDQTPIWFDRGRWGWFHPDGSRDDEHGP